MALTVYTLPIAAKMVQEMGQDGASHTYTPYKRPSLIQRLFARMSTEVDVEGLSSQQMLTTRVKCALSE